MRRPRDCQACASSREHEPVGWTDGRRYRLFPTRRSERVRASGVPEHVAQWCAHRERTARDISARALTGVKQCDRRSSAWKPAPAHGAKAIRPKTLAALKDAAQLVNGL